MLGRVHCELHRASKRDGRLHAAHAAATAIAAAASNPTTLHAAAICAGAAPAVAATSFSTAAATAASSAPPPALPPPPPPPILPDFALPFQGPAFTTTVTETVNNVIIASIAISITASGVGAMAAAGGGGGGGGGLTPLLFGAQRLAASSGLGVPKDESQASVAGSLGWANGELVDFFGSPAAQSRRRLAHPWHTNPNISAPNGTDSDDEDGIMPTPLPNELVTLLNMFITMGLAIVMTFMIQYALILLWRHIINRRYYIRQRAVAAAIDANDLQRTRPQQARRRLWSASSAGSSDLKLLSPPKFVPYPKSLVWPTPLFFTCCIFVTGLTRNSVKLYARTFRNAARAALSCPLSSSPPSYPSCS